MPTEPVTLSFDLIDAVPIPTGEVSNPRNPRIVDDVLQVDADQSTPDTPAYLADLLARTNKVVLSGNMTAQFRKDSPGDRFLCDARDATCFYDTNDGSAAPISIGKGSKADSPAVVGGKIVGRIPWDASWAEVKSRWDAAGIRLEGAGTLYCYGSSFTNIEDGFEPHPAVNPNGNLTNGFRLEAAYFEHIRDDAIENDQGMPGYIVDCYVEGANRFLSEQLDSQGISNPDAVVTISGCVVHMTAMPNDRAKDRVGYGGVFKFMGDTGRVAVKDSVFLIDEPPISSARWPGGTYENVTVVGGPAHPAGRPGYLPTAVIWTKDMSVWDAAVDRWVSTFPGRVP